MPLFFALPKEPQISPGSKKWLEKAALPGPSPAKKYFSISKKNV